MEWVETLGKNKEIDPVEYGRQNFDHTLKAFNESLYAVLVDKTEGEARQRVKAAQNGKGLSAFKRVFEWFTITSGLGIAERRSKIMIPEQAKKPEEVVGLIEAWEKEMRELNELDPEGAGLPDLYKKTALKCILTAEAKEYFDTREEEYETYEDFKNSVMNWAMRRRMEYNRDHVPMDIGAVGSGCNQNDWTQGTWSPMGSSWEAEQGCIEYQGELDAMSKGKARGGGAQYWKA